MKPSNKLGNKKGRFITYLVFVLFSIRSSYSSTSDNFISPYNTMNMCSYPICWSGEH